MLMRENKNSRFQFENSRKIDSLVSTATATGRSMSESIIIVGGHHFNKTIHTKNTLLSKFGDKFCATVEVNTVWGVLNADMCRVR